VGHETCAWGHETCARVQERESLYKAQAQEYKHLSTSMLARVQEREVSDGRLAHEGRLALSHSRLRSAPALASTRCSTVLTCTPAKAHSPPRHAAHTFAATEPRLHACWGGPDPLSAAGGSASSTAPPSMLRELATAARSSYTLQYHRRRILSPQSP
jgi:hypothetical protein